MKCALHGEPVILPDLHQAASSFCRRSEKPDGQSDPMTAANELAVHRTLESAGVEFTDENGSGASWWDVLRAALWYLSPNVGSAKLNHSS
jgi:hypothetical protein